MLPSLYCEARKVIKAFSHNMDVRRTFRALLINEPCLTTDYTYEFSFQTVFYKSPNTGTYCCCPCGFQHEFFSYISEDGDIVEELYSKVIQNIVDGKCPHADDVPNHFLTKTSVYGAHIAAAVGTPKIVKCVPRTSVLDTSGIFHLDAFMVGVSKKNFKSLSYFYDQYIVFFGYIHNKYHRAAGKARDMFVLARSTDSIVNRENVMTVEATSMIEFSLNNRSLTLFEDRFMKVSKLQQF